MIHGNGNGNGKGYGDGDGDGDGYGDGYGYGGDGSGDGYGDGYGYGNGDGNGSGYGNEQVFVDESNPITAYHYVNEDRSIRYEHKGEKVFVESGLLLEHDDDIELCDRGLHASFTKEEAKMYHSGLLTKVACWGRVIIDSNKFVCTHRKVLEIIEEG